MHAQQRGITARQGTKTELVPLVVLSAELLKVSVRVKRSGSRREISGDFSPSISFSVSEPRERRWKEVMDGWQERGRERECRWILHTNKQGAEKKR